MFKKSIYESPVIKRLKIVLAIAVGLLVVLDIIFVLIAKFPTISQVVQDSSPKYLVLIWLYGVATANIFFPITKNERQLVPKRIGAISLTIICCALFVYGFTYRQPNIDCDNFKKVKIQKVYHIVIKTKVDGVAGHDKISPSSLSIEDCTMNKYEFKVDLRPDIKLLILLFGFTSGFIFWRQKAIEVPIK